MNAPSKKTLEARLKKAQVFLKSKGLKAALFEAPEDLLYYTGLTLSLGALLIKPSSATLYIDSRYREQCEKKAPMNLAEYAKLKLVKGAIAFDDGKTSALRLKALRKIATKSSAKLKAHSHMGMHLREEKDAPEVKTISRACALACEAMAFVEQKLKPGITERALAKAIEIFYLERGASISFDPIVAFGPRSAMPHSTPEEHKLKKGDTVLIDMGCKVDHYASDMTRVFFCGPPSKKMQHIYNVVKSALEKAEALCKPGARIADIDKEVRSLIKEADLPPYEHALGHGVGLCVHELPFISEKAKAKKLKTGMVITIEPGIYIPGLGGVRLENQLLITAKGCKNLTPYKL